MDNTDESYRLMCNHARTGNFLKFRNLLEHQTSFTNNEVLYALLNISLTTNINARCNWIKYFSTSNPKLFDREILAHIASFATTPELVDLFEYHK